MTRLLPLLLLAACAPTLAEPPPAADAWRLATLDGAPLGAPATLRFTPTGIAGDAPCNAYGAVVAQGPGGAFSLGAIETTERGCDALEQEVLFYEALGHVTTRTETEGTLTLAGPRHVLVFTR